MDSKRRANCCSILTYWYSNTLVDSVYLNKGRLVNKMIESMNSDPDRDHKLLKKFLANLQANVEQWQSRHPGMTPNAEFYNFTKSAVNHTFGCAFLAVSFTAFLGELCTIVSILTIKYVAEYLTKEENDREEALILLGIFTLANLLGAILRNFYIYLGYVMALEVRKVLVAAMYDKVAKLSMRSLTETNSGKLITLVSADIFTLERPLAMAPFGIAAIVLNVVVDLLIWQIAGWEYALIVTAFWLCTLGMQMCTSRLQKRIKQAEAMRNDERMKLVNDMVTGIRTIKAYAWENHYCEKVRAQRALQERYVFWLNLIGSLGFSVFQNVGMLGILAIFLPKWYMGEKIDMGDGFVLLALLYYLFFSVNSLTYYALTTINQALAVTYRLSEVFRMEEQKLTRQPAEQDKPAIQLEKMEYAWGFRVADDQAKNK